MVSMEAGSAVEAVDAGDAACMFDFQRFACFRASGSAQSMRAQSVAGSDYLSFASVDLWICADIIILKLRLFIMPPRSTWQAEACACMECILHNCHVAVCHGWGQARMAQARFQPQKMLICYRHSPGCQHCINEWIFLAHC